MHTGAGRTVLLVDDEPDLTALLALFFRLEGYEVVRAATGEEALAALDGLVPAAIVTDLVMPGMDGGELISRVREREVLRNVPVILMSALSPPEGVQRNWDAYVPKPADFGRLLALVRQLSGGMPA